MRKIHVENIIEKVATLVSKAACELRPDVKAALTKAYRTERATRAKNTLGIILENAMIAKKKGLPICQDTGMTVVYCDVGQDVHVSGGSLERAIQEGVKKATKRGYLRRSIVKSPIDRVNTNTNTPGIVHYRIVPGEKIRIQVLLKGFGCENKGKVALLNPTAALSDIEDFIVNTIVDAGANACPPFVIGVGLGGTLDKACEMSKHVLFRKMMSQNKKPYLAKLEKAVKKRVNASGVGPLGFGGTTTLLTIFIEECPTHIAGLPVAVNVNCHAMRSAEGRL